MKRMTSWAALSLAAALLSFAPGEGLAQKGKKKKKGKKGDTEQVEGKKKGGKDGMKSVEEFTKDFKLDEGLFNLYQDTAKGSMYIHIPAEAMDDEFIYFSQVEDGVVSSGFFRGKLSRQQGHHVPPPLWPVGSPCGKHQLPRGPGQRVDQSGRREPQHAHSREFEGGSRGQHRRDCLCRRHVFEGRIANGQAAFTSRTQVCAWASSAKPRARWSTWPTTP